MNVMSSSVWRNKWIIIVEPWCELKPADSGMSVLNVTYVLSARPLLWKELGGIGIVFWWLIFPSILFAKSWKLLKLFKLISSFHLWIWFVYMATTGLLGVVSCVLNCEEKCKQWCQQRFAHSYRMFIVAFFHNSSSSFLACW